MDGFNVSYLRTFLFTSALRHLHQKLLRMRGETIFATSCKTIFLHLFRSSVTEKSPPPQDELYVPKLDTFVMFLTFLTGALVTFALNTETMSPQHRAQETHIRDS